MGKSLKVVALVSGGKDSCYSMLQCVSAGHEVVALANLRPKGQLISECLFEVLNFPKKTTKKFDKFLPKNLKSCQIIR